MEVDKLRRRIRLRDLETLIAVIQQGSMRKAAHAIHSSQPVVSRVIRDLEDALQLQLVQRGARGIESTEFGSLLVRRSKAVLDELSGALRELAVLADPEGGEVRLGCGETVQTGLVSATISRLLPRHPRMRFVVESGMSDDLVRHFLRERLIEFVVARPLSMPLPHDVRGEALFRDRMRVVVGKAHPLARRRRIDLVELADEHWILSRNEIMPGSPLAAAFADRGLELPARCIVSGSLAFRYSLLETGGFVTLVPHSLLAFDRHPSIARILPVRLPVWRDPTQILTLRGRTPGPAAALFLKQLRELAVPLEKDDRAE